MESADLAKRLGKRIREIREKRGWSQDILAERCGLNRSCIGALERAVHNAGIRDIALVAIALEVPVEKLFERKHAIDGPPDRLAKESCPSSVLVNKRTFFELLNQCASDRPELVAIYLERCGVVFIQNLN